MGLKKNLFLSVFIILIIAVSFVAFAEEMPPASADSAVLTFDQEPVVTQEKNDTQWAWGEVIGLDNQAKTVTIKYLDYELDQEKELLLEVDDKTTFEGIKGCDELKIADTLSIDYTIGLDNKNTAKNISFDEPDVLMPDLVASQATTQLEAPVSTEAAASQVVTPATESAPPAEVEPPAPDSEPEPGVSGQAQ